MQRVQIRNSRSEKPIKPRVFDALIDGNSVLLEVKNGKTSEQIDLEDVISQIHSAKEKINRTGTTEP